MRQLLFSLVLLAAMAQPVAALADDTTPYRDNRCMVASINSNKNSIYPTSDSEYSAAIGKILVSWRMHGHGYYRAPFTFTSDDPVVRFDMDAGTTAIHAPEVTSQSSDTPVYNLCGQRVGNMVRGNVYIVGGKKVVCHQ